MTDIPRVAVPLDILLGRFENHIAALIAKRDKLRWWQVKQRLILRGAIAAYQVEHDAAMAMGGEFALLHLKHGERAKR